MSVFSALLNNGPLLVGPLADRGAFDQYARYRPGQIVVDDGVTYLNIAALGAAAELEDAFDRRDQQGWGQSSHGEVWQSSSDWANDGPPAIVAGRGLFGATGAAGSDAQLLGPSALRPDAEVLARLSMVTGEGLDFPGACIGLTATEDATQFAFARLVADPDGVASVSFRIANSDGDDISSALQTVPSVVAGQDLWVRVRRVGLDYSATVWPVGAVEPSAPQSTQTAAHAMPAGHLFINASSFHDDAALSVGYVALRPLTAATAPGDDSDHWVALADALQVPQPL